MTPSGPAPALRSGSGEPMVLIHVGACPWRKWEGLLPQLTEQFDVLVPTLPGFPGGPPLTERATIDTATDAIEAAMDAAGFDSAHCVGNSLGGWIAMELARRGRARSAVAFSPAGGWSSRWAKLRIKAFFNTNYWLTKVARPIVPLAMAIPPVRWVFLRRVVQYPLRLRSKVATQIATDTMSGDLPRILSVADDQVQPYPDPGVPTLVAWCERDRLTTLKHDGQVWRRAAPHSQWRVLPDVGHMPMYDDPQLVADTILGVTSKAS